MKKRPNRSEKRTEKRTEKRPEKRKDARQKPRAENRADAKDAKPRGARPNLYGFHAVREAYLNAERNVEALYLTAQAEAGFKDTLKEAASKGLSRAAPQVIDKGALEKMLPPGAVHQGVALAASSSREFDLQDLIIRAGDKQAPLFLMLDQVTDPHNVGAIIRSACAFGAEGIICQKKHAPELDGVLAKTACGAIEHVPVAFVVNLSRSIEELQEAGYFVYGLDERGEMDIGDLAKKPGKCVLVLGAEGPGLRHNVKEHCDALVRLPMHGAMPSINVSNAAAVALYAVKGGK